MGREATGNLGRIAAEDVASMTVSDAAGAGAGRPSPLGRALIVIIANAALGNFQKHLLIE
jgi:hypothetical protein